MNKTEIPWAHFGWSPMTGCSRGCSYCYAARFAKRFPKAFGGEADPFKPTLHPERLDQPLRLRKGARRSVFVVPMGDLFDPAVPVSYIAAVFGVMAARPDLDFIVLTKCWGRMRDTVPGLRAWDWVHEHGAMCGARGNNEPAPWPLPNVYLGFSAWDQSSFDAGWKALAPLAAAGWQVVCSLEPMIGPVELNPPHCPSGCFERFGATEVWPDGDDAPSCSECGDEIEYGHPTEADVSCLSGIILGAESGPGARPLAYSWVTAVRDQCAAANVPFSFKQGPKGCECRDVTWLGKQARVPVLDGRIHVALPWVDGEEG